MIMIEGNELLPTPNETLLPNNVSLADSFWIDPATLGSVRDVINSAHLTTMALGVESRQDEFSLERGEVKAALTDAGTLETKETSLAVEVGFLYGVMLATADQPESVTDRGLPSGFVDRLRLAKDDLDLSEINDWLVYFMRLRDIEVEFTGSDILAYCLASTQDHIAHLFSTKTTEDHSFTDVEITRLQSLYYAGALSGALSATNKALPLANMQIMRSKRSSVEPVGVRTELMPSDNLEGAIARQLTNRYIFTPVKREKTRSIAITPGDLQFGPNALSSPVYLGTLSDSGVSYVIPSDRLDAIIVESTEDGSVDTLVKIIKGKEAIKQFLDPKESIETVRPRVKAVFAKGNLVSAYDIAHPWTSKVERLVSDAMGIPVADLKYCDEMELWKELKIDEIVKPISKYVVLAGLLGILVTDAAASLSDTKIEVNLPQDVAAGCLVLGVLGLSRWLGKKIHRANMASAQQYDVLLQELLDKTGLPNELNSGNISS